MTGPVADVEMKTSVKQRTSRRRHEFDVKILTGTNDAVWKFAHTAESADHRATLVLTIIHTYIIIRAVLRTGTDRPHRTCHDIFTTLTVDVELFVLDVEFDEGQSGVQTIFAVQRAGINTGISRALYVARLQPAVLEDTFAVTAWYDLATTIRIELRVLAVSEIHLELRLGTRIKTEIRLIGEVVRVEDHPHEAGLTDEGLRLFGLATVNARVFAIAHFCLRVAVYDLEQLRGTRDGYITFETIDDRKDDVASGIEKLNQF